MNMNHLCSEVKNFSFVLNYNERLEFNISIVQKKMKAISRMKKTVIYTLVNHYFIK